MPIEKMFFIISENLPTYLPIYFLIIKKVIKFFYVSFFSWSQREVSKVAVFFSIFTSQGNVTECFTGYSLTYFDLDASQDEL